MLPLYAVAGLTAVMYDYILTFPDEVKFVWKAPWSVGKVLYISNRLPALLAEIFFLFLETISVGVGSEFCPTALHLDLWIFLIFFIPTQLMLALRTAAIWNQNKKVLVILATSGILVNLVAIVSLVFASRAEIDSKIPLLRPSFGCNTNVESDNNIGWTSALAFGFRIAWESLNFGLILYKVFAGYSKNRPQLLNVLFKDGIFHYMIIIIAAAVTTVLDVVFQHKHAGIIGIVPSLYLLASNVVVSHIILNVRRQAARMTLYTSCPTTTMGLTVVQSAMAFMSVPEDELDGAVVSQEQSEEQGSERTAETLVVAA